MEKPTFEGYAFVHLMGHKTVVGYVHEETLFGTALIAVDVPAHGEQPARTDYFGGSSLYHLEPTTEDAVQAFYTPRPRLALPPRPDPALVEELQEGLNKWAAAGYPDDDEDDERDPGPTAEEVDDANVEDRVYSRDDDAGDELGEM